jgi:hypothetical protein
VSVGFLKLVLAREATHCDRVSKQPVKADFAATLDATVDCSLCEPFACHLDLVQFLQAAIDMYVVELGQHIRYRLVSGIVHHAGKINVSLIARLQQRGNNVIAYLVIELVEQARQLGVLYFCKLIHIVSILSQLFYSHTVVPEIC